jgi:actin-like ATPase involved in cell morphogenesis
MPYALGIDLGSGHTTAALCRNDHERWSEPEVLALDGLATTESVLHLTDEGTVEVGLRALQHVVSRPDRVTRGFVDRVGDEIPIVLGGRPYPPEVLIAALVGWIVDYAEATEGTPASHLVVTHPAGWGSHRRATLLGALREVSLPELTLLPRPVAAAEGHAATERVEVGQEIAVHSLGAGRFEAAVLRRGSFGFELRAHADSAEPAGGDVFDDLLAAHVLAELGTEVEPVALAKLRASCRSAKERLSTELAVTVPAPARSTRGTVMVNRTDLEELLRPAVEATVTSLLRTIQAAGTSTGSLRAVVLVGGCGRIPLVSELVSAGVRVRVAAAADPELSVARGAALAAARVAKPTVKAPALAHTPEPLQRSAVTHTDLMRIDELPEADVADVGPPPPRPPVDIAPLEPPKRRLLRLGTRGSSQDDDDLLPEDEPTPRRRLSEDDDRPRRRLAGSDRSSRLTSDDDFFRELSADDDHAPSRDDRPGRLTLDDDRPPGRPAEDDRAPLGSSTDDRAADDYFDQLAANEGPRRRPADERAPRRPADDDGSRRPRPTDSGPRPRGDGGRLGPARRRPTDDVDRDSLPAQLDYDLRSPRSREADRRNADSDAGLAMSPITDDDLAPEPPRQRNASGPIRRRENPDHDQAGPRQSAVDFGGDPATDLDSGLSVRPSRRRDPATADVDPEARPRRRREPEFDLDAGPRPGILDDPPARRHSRRDPGAGRPGEEHGPPYHLTEADLRATRRDSRGADPDLPPARHEHTAHQHDAEVSPRRRERASQPPSRHTYQREADNEGATGGADLPPGHHEHRTYQRDTDTPPARRERDADLPPAHQHDTDVPYARHEHATRSADLPPSRQRPTDVPPARHEHAGHGADLPPGRHEHRTGTDEPPTRHQQSGRRHRYAADADVPPARHHDNARRADPGPSHHEQSGYRAGPGRHEQRNHEPSAHFAVEQPPARHEQRSRPVDSDQPSARHERAEPPGRHERASRWADDRAFDESLPRSRRANHGEHEYRGGDSG